MRLIINKYYMHAKIFIIIHSMCDCLHAKNFHPAFFYRFATSTLDQGLMIFIITHSMCDGLHAKNFHPAFFYRFATSTLDQGLMIKDHHPRIMKDYKHTSFFILIRQVHFSGIGVTSIAVCSAASSSFFCKEKWQRLHHLHLIEN